MPKKSLLVAAAAAAVLVVAVPALSTATRPSAVGANAGACPTDLLRLPANPFGPAVAAALASEPPSNRPQARSAALATADGQRGPQVKAQCGARVAARTVLVYLVDRALLPSQSLSQRVVAVGRTSEGYRVWQRLH